MFREAIIAVTKAADWYALHPLTVEELREKNIGSSVSIRYSTLGKNMTPMGNYEPSPINEGVDNVRKGQFRREIPEKAAEYFAYYLDEEGESQLDVFWVMETDDARQAFKKDGAALRQIGNRTKMLRFILEDEYALGHVFAMIHAILEHRDGLLVIPDTRGNIILERRKALDFLNREIRES